MCSLIATSTTTTSMTHEEKRASEASNDLEKQDVSVLEEVKKVEVSTYTAADPEADKR